MDTLMTSEGTTAQDVDAPASARVSADVNDEWSWAAAHARIPQVLDIRVTVSTDLASARVVVELTDDDHVIGRTDVHNGPLNAGESRFGTAHVALAAGYMAGVEERRAATCTVRLESQTGSGQLAALAQVDYPVDLQPRDLWLRNGHPGLKRQLADARDRGADDVAQVLYFADRLSSSLLSTFVRPNNPVIADIAREAAAIRGRLAGDAAFSAFQAADPAEAEAAVEASVTAVYEALRARRIAYSEPPPGWDYDTQGQRIREHAVVANGGLGTCMDTTVLMAAVLEHVGLHPTLMLVPGHIFIGYWRRNPFPGRARPEWYPGAPVVSDEAAVKRLVHQHFLGVIETTALTVGNDADAGRARLVARRHVDHVGEGEGTWIDLIDVAAARRAGISPLPAVRDRSDGRVEVIEYRPGGEPAVTVVQPEARDASAHRRFVDPHPPRYRAWKGALLSLDARSALLNLAPGPSAQPLVIPPEALGTFEDLLHQDIEFEVLSGYELPEIYNARGIATASQLDPSEQAAALAQRKVFIQRVSQTRSSPGPVPPAKLASELRSLARRAKEARDERGMNPLFVAIGMLRWPYQSPTKGLTTADAPIILVPVRLTQRPRSRRMTLSIDTSSHATPNHALIEWLRREHGLDIPDLVEPQADKAGLDVDHVLSSVRTAIAGAGLSLDVISEARLALLDLAAFRMWRDLNENGAAFLTNPLIRHLVHTPTETFVDPASDAPEPEIEAIEVPVPADAAQLRAVGWAGQKRTFVLQGPPGTGKSQTITNMIAHCVGGGMRLLFVAEKQTALAVVQRRLNAVGLGPFTLNLHHEGSSAAEVRAQLKASLTARAYPDTPAMENARRRLRNAHYQLARYPEDLHNTNAAGFSAYTAHDELLVLGDGPEVAIPQTLVARDGATVEAIREVLRDLQRWAAEADVRAGHPWRLAGPTPSGTIDLEAASRAVRDVLDAASWRSTTIGSLRDALDAVVDPGQLRVLAAAADPDLPRGPALDAVLDPAWLERARALVSDCEQSIAGWLPGLRGFAPAVLGMDLRAIQTQLAESANGNPFTRKSRRAAAIAPLAPFTSNAQPIESSAAEAVIAELVRLQDVDRSVREALRSLPGVQVPDSLTPFAPDGLGPVRLQIGKLASATAPLRGATDWDAAVRALAASGGLAAYRDRLVGLAATWDLLIHALAVRPADLGTWRSGLGLMDAVDRHADTWKDQVTYDRLLMLQRWVNVVSRLTPLEAAGLTDLRSDILDGRVAVDGVEEAFARGVARASLEERIRATGLDRFDSAAHDERVKTYIASEAEVRRQWVNSGPASLLDRRGGDGFGFSGTSTGALARELEKTRGRLGTRALLRVHGAAVQSLTPVVLTSPSSAVDLIEPGVIDFDLVIFDEASQIAVPEAIGAMGRAKAAIVVGDSKQMPPSRRVGADPSQDEESDNPDVDEIIEDQESILSECELARVPTVQLTWHYRSQDEALIAFSNRAYYESTLSSFPTPSLLSQETGVEFRKVEGVYRRSSKDHRTDGVELLPGVTAGPNTNPAEAMAIVEAVLALIDAHPSGRPSLGIVTFNEQQRTLIEDLLRAPSADPRIAAILDETTMGPTEVLFVKALEQVQGDERDVVLFSVAFSEQANGRIPLNFGRLSNLGGERRLNVAITRARRKNIVFCSFEPGKLEAEKSSYRGVKDLKRFLEFARTAGSLGEAVDAAAKKVAVRDRHRDEIASVLRERGLHVLVDVGLSDFRLDLVLSRPERPDRVILPVLLDGESWHRRQTVSDRDVLPVQVLRDLMGWPTVARVWWPMWLQNRALAIDTLMTEFENAAALLDERDATADHVTSAEAHESEPEAEAVTPEPEAVDVALVPEPVRQPMSPAASAAAHEFVDAPGWGVLFDPSPTLPLPDPGTDERPNQPAEPPSAPVLTGAAVEPQTRPSRRATSDMATYTSWSGAGLTPADRASTEEIAAALEEIVRVEGPMHAELAYRRYLAASGGVRLGSAIKRTLNQVTASLVRRGRLVQIRDHVPGQIEKTLYAPGTPAVSVREIGDRSLSDVPRSEVLALIENLGLTKDDPTAKRAVLGAYGRVALTKAADAYLESCIAYSWSPEG